jgi:hypothetical protein
LAIYQNPALPYPDFGKTLKAEKNAKKTPETQATAPAPAEKPSPPKSDL